MVWVIIGVLLVVVLVIVLLSGGKSANSRDVRVFVADWCRDAGVPNVSFDLDAYVRQVVQGRSDTRLLPGQYWVIEGIEVIDDPSLTRKLVASPEYPADLQPRIAEMFRVFGGNSILPPHSPETRFIGDFPGAHEDVIYARMTGRMRPLGGWIVAIPASLIP